MAHIQQPSYKEMSTSAGHTSASAVPQAPLTSPVKASRKLRHDIKEESGELSPDALYFGTRGRQSRKRTLAYFGHHRPFAKRSVAVKEQEQVNTQLDGIHHIEHL